ncbi:MAG: hypothetical protein [Bacteriophage sp.]|nr:MAG: hypothetical protein [Bacteriophage sp.]
MIKHVSGNCYKMLEDLPAEVILNITTGQRSPLSPLSQVLFRKFEPVYSELVMAITSHFGADAIGKYGFRNVNGQTHVCLIQEERQAVIGFAAINPSLIDAIKLIANDMRTSGKKSILLPYLGAGQCGMRWTDWCLLMSQIFGSEITVYIFASDKYTGKIQSIESVDYGYYDAMSALRSKSDYRTEDGAATITICKKPAMVFDPYSYGLKPTA